MARFVRMGWVVLNLFHGFVLREMKLRVSDLCLFSVQIPHTFLNIKWEPGQGDRDPLVETILNKYDHINLNGYGNYLMPSLSVEVVGPDMRCKLVLAGPVMC